MGLLQKVPGFRSGVWWKSLIAVPIYLFIFLVILALIIPTAPSLALDELRPTNKNSVAVTGKTSPNKPVQLIKEGIASQSITADSDGKFIFPINDLAEGNYTYTVKVCLSENNHCANKTVLVVIDQTPPAGPIIALPNDLPQGEWEQVSISGTAEPNSLIVSKYADTDLLGITTDDSGTFTINANFTAGSHLLSVKVIDQAGNESQPATATINFNPLKTKAVVYRVIDGDTIKINEGKQTVRYIGIDTPETVHPSKPVQCFGREASAKNKELVEGKEVILEKDVSETDKYDRLLRYVWLGDTLINELLVKEGFAQSSTYPPDIKYQDHFIKAQNEAMENKTGLWGPICSEISEVITNTSTNNQQQPTGTTPQPTKSTTTTQPSIAPATTGSFTCNCSKSCGAMVSCEEAYYQLNTCGCKARDGDDDGVPCESICPGG